jgi:hypothetical protein
MTPSEAKQTDFSSVSKIDLKSFLKTGFNERKIIKSSFYRA